MTKHKLIIDDSYDFLCFGISCHLKDYRVAWSINNIFKYNLVRTTIPLTDKQNNTITYSAYKWQDEDNRLNFVLLSNASDDIPLVAAYKEFDFIMIIEGYIELFDSELFLEKLQGIEALQYVTELDPQPLEKIQYVLFE